MFITFARLIVTAAGAAALSAIDALNQVTHHPGQRRLALAYVPVSPSGARDPRRSGRGWS